MHLLLIILGSLLAVLLTLFVLALVMPLDVRFHVGRFARVQASVEARAFGKWGPWIKIVPGKENPARKKPTPTKRKNASRFKTKRTWPEIAAAAKRLFSDLAGVFSIHDLNIKAEFGTFDPADTGVIYGIVAPLNYSSCNKIALYPNFDGPFLQGNCTVTLQFRPLRLVMPSLRFAWALLGSAK